MTSFEKNIKLVYFVFNKNFNKYGHLKEDLCQEGLLTLWKVCRKPNNKKSKFSTYATKAIYFSMLNYLTRKELKHEINCISLDELKGVERYVGM